MPPVLRRTAVLVSPVHVVNFCFRLAKARFLGVGWIVTCSVFRFRFRHSFFWFSPRFFCERISTSLADLLLEHSGPNLSQRMLSRNTFWSSKIYLNIKNLTKYLLELAICSKRRLRKRDMEGN